MHFFYREMPKNYHTFCTVWSPKKYGAHLMIPVQNQPSRRFFVEGTASEKKTQIQSFCPRGKRDIFQRFISWMKKNPRIQVCPFRKEFPLPSYPGNEAINPTIFREGSGFLGQQRDSKRSNGISMMDRFFFDGSHGPSVNWILGIRQKKHIEIVGS